MWSKCYVLVTPYILCLRSDLEVKHSVSLSLFPLPAFVPVANLATPAKLNFASDIIIILPKEANGSAHEKTLGLTNNNLKPPLQGLA